MTAVLGINCVYHESAAALVVDGDLVAACEEERFSRVKHGKSAEVHNASELPLLAVGECLAMAEIEPNDLDWVALSFSPELRRERFALDELSHPGDWGSDDGERTFQRELQAIPEKLRAFLGGGFAGGIVTMSHHLSHAASAFYPSGFERAAVLVVDGIAESETTAMFEAEGRDIRTLGTIDYPHSIGFVWEKLSAYLGFSPYDASKTMGLAAYGDPDRFGEPFARLMAVDGQGYRVDPNVARFRLADFESLERLLGPRRLPDDAFEQRHYDIAAALQQATIDALSGLVQRLAKTSDARHLCLAGGVALNCVANAALNRLDDFEALYVPPAPHDAGTAVGAALHQWHSNNSSAQRRPVTSPYLGPAFTDETIRDALASAGLTSTHFQDHNDLACHTAEHLIAGNIVAWFQGRMEFGPRALGNRSLLADPRDPGMRAIMNRRVKHREDFRPFAPSVLAEDAENWFEIGRANISHGYMLFTVPARPERADQIPAVLHHDGSARVQLVDRQLNPRFHDLIRTFAARTGVPMLLNTSFNDSEPIVCTPQDAIATFLKTEIDVLVLGNHLVTRPA